MNQPIQSIRHSVMAWLTAVVVACVFLHALVCVAPVRHFKQVLNNRPIIGVLSQELSYELGILYPNNYSSYIAASYVKFLESAGARVVPIRINRTRSYYEKIINSVNGVLFPGGAAKFNNTHGYGEAGTILYQLAEKKNQQGDYFPVWGICLGFELFTFITAQQKDIVTLCNVENIALPLEFKKGYFKSRLYGQAPDNIITSLKTQNATANFHKYCVVEKRLKQYGLDAYWNVLSLNHNLNGLRFVSSFEHRQYPFYGVQFHPEKNAFEWSPNSHDPHFAEAILVGQYFGNFLVNEARRNNHHFATSQEENQALIYNYVPVYTENTAFEQIYFFTN